MKAIVFFLAVASFSINSFASATSQQEFESRLSGIEKLVYAIPSKAQAELAQMEEELLIDNQTDDLLIRYYLTKSTIYYLLQDYNLSLQAARQGLKLAQPDSSEGLQLNLKVIQAMLNLGQPQEAVAQLDTLLQIAQSRGDKLVEAEALLTKGMHLDSQGALKRSYAAILSSINSAEASGNSELAGRAAFALGRVLLKLNGFERSQVMLQEAQSFFESRKMSFSQMLALLDIAALHEKQQQLDQALASYQSALMLADILGDGRYRFRIHLHLADLYRDTEQKQQMQQHLQAADELQNREILPYYMAKFQLLKAQNLLDRNDLDNLVSFLAGVIPALQSSAPLYRSQVELLKVAAQGYAGKGDYQLAYQLFSEYHRKYSSFNNQQHLQDLARQQVLFELERLEYENHNLNWKNVLQKLEIEESQSTVSNLASTLTWLLLFAVTLLLVILWINRSRVKWGKLARTDTLTGLYNRRYLTEWYSRQFYQGEGLPFTQRLIFRLTGLASQFKQDSTKQMASEDLGAKLAKHMRRLKRAAIQEQQSGPFTLILTDIDYFKNINDNHGHDSGDRVLAKVAAVFKDNVRSTDVVARVGGEEFMIMLPNTDYQAGLRIAETLRERVAEQPVALDSGQFVQVTASFGVLTTSPAKGTDFTELCSKVDELLYAAKAQGRNCVVSLQTS
ncbi:GGDEF domain-containing protein [Bowmanella denitrificans]|uniref:diguanylate cyclase n=1 Tax=Bowmanella denitrificans TaxID=366582 RepID=A0ABN0XRR7_9ALTE